MYIEELEIDSYLTKLKQYEDMDEEQQWDAQEPVMTPSVVKYYELGELFLDDIDEDENANVSADIMSISPDIFG